MNKNPKPLIGIVAKPLTDIDMWHYTEIVDDIRLVLNNNGALAVGLLPTDRKLDFKPDEEPDTYVLTAEEKADLEDTISRLDGVVLEGGLVSNEYEEEIVRICIAKDIPVLGICSGFNNVVRALGGTVHIDANIFHNQFGSKIAHEVDLAEDSKLYDILKEQRVVVNSIHTCIALEDEIKDYKIVAKCPVDNTVEAVELEGKRFVMGIKWHPELMPSMNSIFSAFVQECAKTAKPSKLA